MGVPKRTLALNTVSIGVHAVLNVDLGYGASLVNWLRHMASACARTMLKSNRLVAQSRHIGQRLLIVEAAASTIEVVHLFALQLVLNTLSVGGVTDKWKYRTNTVDKECTLVGLRIVKSGLE